MIFVELGIYTGVEVGSLAVSLSLQQVFGCCAESIRTPCELRFNLLENGLRLFGVALSLQQSDMHQTNLPDVFMIKQRVGTRIKAVPVVLGLEQPLVGLVVLFHPDIIIGQACGEKHLAGTILRAMRKFFEHIVHLERWSFGLLQTKILLRYSNAP